MRISSLNVSCRMRAQRAALASVSAFVRFPALK
jgi:hypothetical protein